MKRILLTFAGLLTAGTMIAFAQPPGAHGGPGKHGGPDGHGAHDGDRERGARGERGRRGGDQNGPRGDQGPEGRPGPGGDPQIDQQRMLSHAMGFDQDKDGMLNEDELKAFIAEFAEEHQGQMRGGREGRGGPNGNNRRGAGRDGGGRADRPQRPE